MVDIFVITDTVRIGTLYDIFNFKRENKFSLFHSLTVFNDINGSVWSEESDNIKIKVDKRVNLDYILYLVFFCSLR